MNYCCVVGTSVNFVVVGQLKTLYTITVVMQVYRVSHMLNNYHASI